MRLTARTFRSPRHATRYWEAGPIDGPLMIFLHGWPEIGLMWRAQIEAFAAEGWRCVAPDMRGYGGSSAPTASEAYALDEIVDDMVELHDHLGARPAIWVGHDWGSPVAGALAAHHAARSRGVVLISVPYFSGGLRAAEPAASDRPSALPRRPISGRAVGLLSLLPEPTSTRRSATWRRTFRRPWRRSIGRGTLRPRARSPRLPCSRAMAAVTARRIAPRQRRPTPRSGRPPTSTALVEAFHATRLPPGQRLVSERHRQHRATLDAAPDGGHLTPARAVHQRRLGRDLRHHPQPPRRAHAPRLPGPFRDEPGGRPLAAARAQDRNRPSDSLVAENENAVVTELSILDFICRHHRYRTWPFPGLCRSIAAKIGSTGSTPSDAGKRPCRNAGEHPKVAAAGQSHDRKPPTRKPRAREARPRGRALGRGEAGLRAAEAQTRPAPHRFHQNEV